MQCESMELRMRKESLTSSLSLFLSLSLSLYDKDSFSVLWRDQQLKHPLQFWSLDINSSSLYPFILQSFPSRLDFLSDSFIMKLPSSLILSFHTTGEWPFLLLVKFPLNSFLSFRTFLSLLDTESVWNSKPSSNEIKRGHITSQPPVDTSSAFSLFSLSKSFSYSSSLSHSFSTSLSVKEFLILTIAFRSPSCYRSNKPNFNPLCSLLPSFVPLFLPVIQYTTTGRKVSDPFFMPFSRGSWEKKLSKNGMKTGERKREMKIEEKGHKSWTVVRKMSLGIKMYDRIVTHFSTNVTLCYET